MQNLTKIRKLYELKNVNRMGRVKERHESSAEHSWSCSILANYFLDDYKELDKLKVYELLMYHDLVEIEAGDIPIHHEERRTQKKEKEQKAMEKLKHEIPLRLKNRFTSLFNEFEDCKSKEAKFARAIDRLDAVIHELDYKANWKGWSEAMVRKYNDSHFDNFPSLKEIFEQCVDLAKNDGFFTQ